MKAFSCPSDIPWREEGYQPPFTEIKLSLRGEGFCPKAIKLRGVKLDRAEAVSPSFLHWIHLKTGSLPSDLVIAAG